MRIHWLPKGVPGLRLSSFLAAGLVGAALTGCEEDSGGGTKVAIVQYLMREPDAVGGDARRLAQMIEQAAQAGADLVVTPETAFYRYAPAEQNGVSMADLAAQAEMLENGFARLASFWGIHLVISFREPADGEWVYNTAVLFGPNGAVLGRHRKCFTSNEEKRYTAPGTGPTVVRTSLGTIGLAICKDIYSRGLAEHYAAAGVDLVVAVSADANGQELDAIDNLCAGANCPGILANQAYGNGNSAWITPAGAVQYLGPGEQIFYRDLESLRAAPE